MGKLPPPKLHRKVCRKNKIHKSELAKQLHIERIRYTLIMDWVNKNQDKK